MELYLRVTWVSELLSQHNLRHGNAARGCAQPPATTGYKEWGVGNTSATTKSARSEMQQVRMIMLFLTKTNTFPPDVYQTEFILKQVCFLITILFYTRSLAFPNLVES